MYCSSLNVKLQWSIGRVTKQTECGKAAGTPKCKQPASHGISGVQDRAKTKQTDVCQTERRSENKAIKAEGLLFLRRRVLTW
eukprot:425838-Prorocentrum_minimum.AAC.1